MARRNHKGDPALDEAVGYGRPPRKHRICEGEVRNPWGGKGRPKPKSDFLEEQQQFRVDGRLQKMTRNEAIDHALYRVAMTGNVSAAKLLEARRRDRLAAASRDDGGLAPEDEAALLRLIERRRHGGDADLGGGVVHRRDDDDPADAS